MAHQRFVCNRLPFQGGPFKRHTQCILAHTELTICTLLASLQISSARGGLLSLAVKSVIHLTCPRCYVYCNFTWFPLKWNKVWGKYLLFEQYSKFTTFCLLGFVVIFCLSVAFRIYLALSAQRDRVTAWHNLSHGLYYAKAIWELVVEIQRITNS